MKFQLTIATNYCSTWGAWEGCRELVQNGLDAQDDGAEMKVSHHIDTFRVVSQGVKLDARVWLMGTTSKSSGGYRGHFGEGLKLGVQSSSDHVSTHSSYACILVEEFTRPGLVDAMRKRHTYAATDSIVMDYRIVAQDVSALMGDVVNLTEAPKLQVRILGTAPIRQVDIIRNNTYIHKLTPNQADVKFEYLDTASTAGEAYYYVRAEQADGQLVWSSPIWVRRAQ